mmetsp:Transcript_34550/g.90490  ORF Transcript_34550/g.90490 Transcript_34550/m.90490 type:complete len:788 (-) Transcript_34550:42-2405(-)
MAGRVTATAFLDQDTELASWFFAGVTAHEELAEIENNLLTDGPVGAFILRDIEAAPDCFGLEYKGADGAVSGALIEATPDGTACRIRGVGAVDERFQTVWELLGYYSHKSRPAFGVRLDMGWLEGELDAPARRGSISSISLPSVHGGLPTYHHGLITEGRAEELLLADGGTKDAGRFLLRFGTDGINGEEVIIISVVAKGAVAHLRTVRSAATAAFTFNRKTTGATSYDDLVAYFRKKRRGFPSALRNAVEARAAGDGMAKPSTVAPESEGAAPEGGAAFDGATEVAAGSLVEGATTSDTAAAAADAGEIGDGCDGDLSDWENEDLTSHDVPMHGNLFQTDGEKLERLDQIADEKARLQTKVATARERLRIAVADRQANERSRQMEESRLQDLTAQRLAAKEMYIKQRRLTENLKLTLLEMKKNQVGNERTLEDIEVKKELARQEGKSGEEQLVLVAAQHTRALSEIAANAEKVTTIRERRLQSVNKLRSQITALELISTQRLESKVNGAEALNVRAKAEVERARQMIANAIARDHETHAGTKSSTGISLPSYIENALHEHDSQKDVLQKKIDAIRSERAEAQARQAELKRKLDAVAAQQRSAGPAVVAIPNNVTFKPIEAQSDVEKPVEQVVEQDEEQLSVEVSEHDPNCLHRDLSKEAANKLLLADGGARETGKFLLRTEGGGAHDVWVSVIFNGKPTHHHASRDALDAPFTLYKKNTKQTTLSDLVTFLSVKRRGWPVALSDPVVVGSLATDKQVDQVMTGGLDAQMAAWTTGDVDHPRASTPS